MSFNVQSGDLSATAAVDYVFRCLAAAYGSAWDRSLGAAPLADIKKIWCEDLSEFIRSENSKRAILWALKNRPETVPNSIQFRNLCRHAPAVEASRIEAPKADPERIKVELAKLVPLRQAAPTAHDPRAWARSILVDHKSGLRRSPTVVLMARQAFGDAA